MPENEQIILLRRDFESFKTEANGVLDQLVEMQEENRKGIRHIKDSSADLLSAWQAANGAIRVGVTLSKFIKWLGSVAVVGVIINWAVEKI